MPSQDEEKPIASYTAKYDVVKPEDPEMEAKLQQQLRDAPGNMLADILNNPKVKKLFLRNFVTFAILFLGVTYLANAIISQLRWTWEGGLIFGVPLTLLGLYLIIKDNTNKKK